MGGVWQLLHILDASEGLGYGKKVSQEGLLSKSIPELFSTIERRQGSQT